MKTLLKISAISFFLVLFSSACEKTNIDTCVVDYRPDTVDFNPLINKMQNFSADTLYISCIAIPYPIDFKQLSGNVLTVNDSADLNLALLNQDSITDFVYPIQAYRDGNLLTILNINDLVTEVVYCDTTSVSCADLDPHVLLFFNALNIFTLNKYTYTIQYPVQIQVNGQNIVLNQDSDYLPAIGGNPMQPDSATLVYPITIHQFGQSIVLNSDQDVCNFYASLDEACQNKPAHIQFFFNEGAGTPITCTYFINYPVQATYNGNTVQFQSFSDYASLLDNDPNAYNGISLIFPVTVAKYQNNQNLTFTSDLDICNYLTTCN